MITSDFWSRPVRFAKHHGEVLTDPNYLGHVH